MSKLLPILLVVIGLLAGIGAGFALRPPSLEEECMKMAEDGKMSADGMAGEMDEDACKEVEKEKEPKEKVATAFAELERQFVVPILANEKVVALVVASLALEVDEGSEEGALGLEPKLRDSFLTVLFVHAHSGGFDGDFTSQAAIEDLKGRLFEAASDIIGDTLHDVLLTEIVRQEL